MSFQYDLYLDISGLCRISRTGTGTVVDYVISVGLVLRVYSTDKYKQGKTTVKLSKYNRDFPR